MKQLIICAVALAASTFSVQAQEKKFHFGGKAGASLATLAGDAEDVEAIAGLHAGVFAEYMFNENFSIQPELVFSMQGAQSDHREDNFGTIVENDWLRLNYLNMPVLVKYHFTKVKGLSVGLGPQVGLLLSAKMKYYTETEGVRESHKEDVKDSFKSIDLGLAGGVEYELPIQVFFGVRANIGLMNINDTAGDDIYNSVVQLSAGYRF